MKNKKPVWVLRDQEKDMTCSFCQSDNTDKYGPSDPDDWQAPGWNPSIIEIEGEEIFLCEYCLRYAAKLVLSVGDLNAMINEIQEEAKSRLQAPTVRRSSISTADRLTVYKRDGFACLKCGCDEIISLTVDHIIPLSMGGESAIDNYQTLCRRCNSGKRNKHINYRNTLKKSK